jgi:hypothetical protein
MRASLPDEVDVDKMIDHRHPGIQYWGKAKRQLDGTYRCLANVEGSLCVVEVKITPPEIGDEECRV